MFHFTIILIVAAFGGDWRGWRGPDGNGVAAGAAPLRWSAEDNIVWRTAVPGRGHSSPIVVDDQVLLTTADEESQTQSVVCFDRITGEQRWQTEVSSGGFAPKIHNKNTHATPTLTSDGERLYGTFSHHQSVQLVCLDLQGKLLWSERTGGYVPARYKFGYAPSPLLYNNQVIVASEYEKGGFLAAFNRSNGKELWRTPRGEFNNYSSPVIAHTDQRDQLLLSGGAKVSAFDPGSGKLLWSCPGMWDVTCGTVVWNDELVFASGGYPKNGTMAVRSDGSEEIVWTNPVKCYEQSMLLHQGHLYAVSDAGVAYCWVAKSGEEKWKARLVSPISASLVLAGDHIYATSERGETVVYQANPDRFKEVARNRLGDESFASPAVCDGKIFLRLADHSDGSRKEWLYCIGK